MKVLFSNPPWWDTTSGELRGGIRAGSRWPFTHRVNSRPDQPVPMEYLPFPFFMGYAASYLARNTVAEVQVRDSIALRESYETYFEFVTTAQPEFIVIESATPSWAHDEAIIRTLDKIIPDAKVIVTGPVASARSVEILALRNVVAAVQGEYEKGVLRAVNGEFGLIPHDLLSVAEMNAAPFPIMPTGCAETYWDACPRGQRAPQLQVWTSRGCPFKCIFCVWPAVMTGNDPDGTSPRRVRYYSSEYMREYLREMTHAHQYGSIYLDDDTFNLSDKHTLEMCEVMREIGLPWSAMCRADTVTRETWQEMKGAGCFGVKLGFESGNQYVVNEIVNKHLDLEAATATVHFLKEIGMTVHGTFTVGLPGETQEQVQDTVDFIKRLPFDSHQLSGTAEIEGTPLATLSQKGHLDAYAGATIDKGYVSSGDGQKKIEGMSV